LPTTVAQERPPEHQSPTIELIFEKFTVPEYMRDDPRMLRAAKTKLRLDAEIKDISSVAGDQIADVAKALGFDQAEIGQKTSAYRLCKGIANALIHKRGLQSYHKPKGEK
jgi:hypothetical protein